MTTNDPKKNKRKNPDLDESILTSSLDDLIENWTGKKPTPLNAEKKESGQKNVHPKMKPSDPKKPVTKPSNVQSKGQQKPQPAKQASKGPQRPVESKSEQPARKKPIPPASRKPAKKQVVNPQGPTNKPAKPTPKPIQGKKPIVATKKDPTKPVMKKGTPVPKKPETKTSQTAIKPKPKPKPATKIDTLPYVFDRFYEKIAFPESLEARKALALDIDSDKIRYLVIKKSRNGIQVKSWGVQKFPTEEQNRFKALQIALENITSKVYKQGMQINASIFSPDIKIRQLTIPKMAKESDLKSALYHRNQTDLQNFDEHSIWTYKITEEFEDDEITKLRVLMVVVPEDIVQKYVHVFNNLKLKITTLIPRPIALQSAYRKMIFRPDKDMVIDISYDFTQICLLRHGNLEYIRNVGIGARNLEVMIHDDKDKKQKSQEDIDMAEPEAAEEGGSTALKNRLMSKIKDLQNKQNPVLHTFFSEILRSLAFIQGRNYREYIENIFITGYAIRKESLIPYLKGRLNIPIFVLAPQFADDGVKSLNYGEYYSTVGTALHSDKLFNLLPKKYLTGLLFKKLNALLVFIMIVSFVAAGYLSLIQKRVTDSKVKLTEQYNQEYEKLNPIEGMYKDFQQQISEVTEENQELKSYIKPRPPLIEVMRFFSNETPKDIRLEKLSFVQLVPQGTGKKKNEKFRSDYKYQVELEGVLSSEILMSDVGLINFMNHLNSLDYFKHVELLNKMKNPEEKSTRFTLRLYL